MSRNYNNRASPIAAEIEKFSHDGRGIARVEGKTTFVEGALPGERVLLRYLKKKKDYDEATVVSVLAPSAIRAEPKCAHYSQCGGCSLQHLPPELQIQEKQKLLLDLLQRTGHCQPDTVLPPLAAKYWHYRDKARLSVRFIEKKGAVLIGFREKNNPRYIAEINSCSILHEKVGQHIVELQNLLQSMSSPQAIAQIEVAAGDDEVALIFRNLQDLTATDKEKLQIFARNYGFIVFLQPGNATTVQRFYPNATEDYLSYSLKQENLLYKFHPTDFTQINAGLNALMIERALDLLHLNAEDIVLDLFCGLGNFSLPIAKRAKKVLGIEGSAAMVERATMNAAINNIANVEFMSADLDKPDSLATIEDLKGITKVLVDPPRSGALAVMKQIAKIKPQRIVYVSCNPATLARDSDILVNSCGYRLRKAGVMDMFPHTAHVESIALFEKDK